MPRLVTKFKYMRPGADGKSLGGYAKYIATREGVEKIDDSHHHALATQKQREMITKLLRDFPDVKQSHEYKDYCREKTIGNASELITRTMEENMGSLADSKTYADYIATRPRAERFGSHGLFTDDGVEVQLSKVSQELNEYTGNVYTAILSLRREDADRLGFDNGSRWRDFLRSQTQTLAENLKIPMDHLRWYAAYHNEGHHPHVHLIAYSCIPGEGHLNKKGVEKMRSGFAGDIFAQDLLHTYEQQTEIRDQLREQGRETVAEIVQSINDGYYENPKVESLLVDLSERLSRTSGKKVYGYLKADVKAIVDQIVAELAADERIRKLYDLWYEQREDVLRTYTDTFPERIPLEQNREFKTIRNAVIQEAMKIVNSIQQAAELEPQQDIGEANLPPGEEPSIETMEDLSYWIESFQPRFTEPVADTDKDYSDDYESEDAPPFRSEDSKDWWSGYYKLARRFLYGTKEEKPDYQKAMPLLLLEANCGNGYACYNLGRMYLLGQGCEEDEEEAQRWFRDALEAFHKAEQTAEKKDYLRYQIGRCYAIGYGTEQNYKESTKWFRLAAEDGNSFAEYQMGKIYYFGNGVRADREKGLEYLKESAAHGNAYATNLLQVIQHQHTWGAASCVASLFTQLGWIFQEQDQKQSHRQWTSMDRKHRYEIEEKKQALGIRD